MRVRTYIGVLLAFLVVVATSFLTHHNRDTLQQPFRLGPERTVPFYAVLIVVFLAGFLPTVTLLLVQTLKRDLATRRDRRASRQAESLDASFRRAIDCQADGQWARAAAELEVVLAERPDDFSVLLRYGEVLRRLGRDVEALEVHRRASVVYPQSVALLYQLAEDYEARHEPGVAREIRNRVLRDFPGLGLSLLRRQRDAALAARDWREAAELQERVEALLVEGGETATRELEVGVSRGLEYQRGVTLLEGEQPEAAIEVFRSLLDQEPCFIPAAIMLGEAELVLEDEKAAVDEWLEGYRRTGSPVFLQRIEDHFIEGEQPVRAIETLRELIAGADNDVLPRFFLGRLYYRLEMHGEAMKLLDGLGDEVGSSPTYHFLLARLHERRGEMRRALDAYATCARLLGVGSTEFRCRICRTASADWHDRCDVCGTWNSVELDFQEEKVSAEELGLHEAPVWGGYGPADPPTGFGDEPETAVFDPPTPDPPAAGPRR